MWRVLKAKCAKKNLLMFLGDWFLWSGRELSWCGSFVINSFCGYLTQNRKI
jgi:hypothetical protein